YLTQLGLIAKLQGQWDEARVPFRKIVELEPDNAFGRENFGEVNEVLGNHGEAVRQYLASGDLYEKKGDTAKAVEVFQNALALDRENPSAHNRLKHLEAPETPKKRVAGVIAAGITQPAPSRTEKTVELPV